MTVSDGAAIKATGGRIGLNGTGSLLVTGADSRFLLSGTLQIGSFAWGTTAGHGTVTISDGGLVSALDEVRMGVGSGASGALVVNTSGVLETAALLADDSSSTATFDNGTLRASADSTPGVALIYGFAPGAFTIGSGGMYLDSNGFNVTAATAMSGGGGLTKQGAGTLTLTDTNTYAGDTTIEAGTLQAGAANTFSPNSAVDVASLAALDLDGFEQTVAGLANAGVVNMGVGTAPGTVLTVNNAYVGNGGTIVFNTVLGADASLTDIMVVNGSTSGQTGVKVVNAGGMGAQTTGNGIELIQVNGASNGAFSLIDPVAAGAYNYNLFKNGVGAIDGGWYLRSSLRPETAVESSVVPSVSVGSLALMGDASDRGAGDVFCDDEGAARPRGTNTSRYPGGCSPVLWGRIIGQTGDQGGAASSANGSPAYEYGFYGIQTGADLVRTANDRAGLYFGYGNWDSTVRGFDGGAAGKVGYDAYAIGGYWTHQYGNGLYTDLAVQGAWYRNLRASANGGSGISTNARSATVQAEAGYRLGLGDGWAMTPKGALVYQAVNVDNALDPSALVSFGSTDELYGRLGVRVAKDWTAVDGGATQVFGELNMWGQLGDRNAKTTFTNLQGGNPTTLTSRLGGSWIQLKAGASSRIAETVSAFAAVDGDVGLDHTGYAIGGHVGIRVGF